MTINDLYWWAKSHGVANNKLVISTFCSDDYYNFDEEKFDKENLKISRNLVIVEIADEEC